MEWNKHYALKNKHAILSASQPGWVHYDPDRLFEYIQNKEAAERGTRLHAWAAETIELGIKQWVPRGKVKTIESYINDAIGFHMDCEVLLYYSDRIFGTADAIVFKNGRLRIHDLKTGKRRIHQEQLKVYAALFCLEYKEDPEDMRSINLCVYQNDEIIDIEASDDFDNLADEIRFYMNTIKEADKMMVLRGDE